jgi:hypothetical protein
MFGILGHIKETHMDIKKSAIKYFGINCDSWMQKGNEQFVILAKPL